MQHKAELEQVRKEGTAAVRMVKASHKKDMDELQRQVEEEVLDEICTRVRAVALPLQKCPHRASSANAASSQLEGSAHPIVEHIT